MGRIFGWAGLSTLLIAATVIFQPSAVNAQVTTYPATNHSNMTALPLEDYPIVIPNTAILSAYDFTSRLAKDFVPFAQNLGFNVQVIGTLTGSSWSISVYTPGNAMPVMEVTSKAASITTGPPAGNQPLKCAWGPNRTATINFRESQTPDALFPPSDCKGIFVQVSPKPGFQVPPFSSSPILQNAQDAVNYLNSQLTGIPGAPQFLFAPPPSPGCTAITILPASSSGLPSGDVAVEMNITHIAEFSFATTQGTIQLENDDGANPNDYNAGPLLEHELLHALGLGHTGEAMGHAPFFSPTDIMSLTSTTNGITRAFTPLTADEKQALKDIYGGLPLSLSASERKKFCITANQANAAEGGGSGATGSGTGAGTGSGSGSCLLTCPSPFVVEPNSCSCVCSLTASACLPGFVDAQQCQCYRTKSTLLTCDPSIVCPAGSFADPTVNCQCVAEIGAQAGNGCDPSKTVDDPSEGGGVQCGTP
jgi:hypothetical protein